MNIQNRIYIYLFILLTPLLAHAEETAYLSQIEIGNYSLDKPMGSKNAYLRVEFNFDSLELNEQHVLRIVPVLYSADGAQTYSLPGVQLYGKQRYKVAERANKLSGEPMVLTGDSLHNYQKDHTAPLNYSVTIPYKRWMSGSHLRIKSYTVGCAYCEEGNETTYLAETLLPMPEWKPTYVGVQPLPVVEKQRYEPHRAYIQFAQSKHDIRPALAGNAEQLDSVFSKLESVIGDEKLTLTAINVEGWVSPEGTLTYNQGLSERRANSFMDYVSRRVKGINKKLWHAEGKGEAWGHLQTLLVETPLPADSTAHLYIQEAIDNPADADNIDRRLRALPEIGNTIYQKYYPLLRCILYTLHYEVRPFTVEEGCVLIDTRPHLFSPNEMQQVADSYLPDTVMYIKTLQKAVKQYPADTALVYNLALALFNADRKAEALRQLENIEPTAPICNLRGVLCMELQRYADAVPHFKQAIELGSQEAKQNLPMAEAVINLAVAE